MIWIKVNNEAIEAINKDSEQNKIKPVKTTSGDWVVNADLLTDEQTWGHAIPYLEACPKIELTLNDFPQPKTK